MKEQMDKFTGPNSTEQLASEVKLAMISFQWTPNNKLPYFQLAAYPQSKNEPSDFNDNVTKGCIGGVEKLQKMDRKFLTLGIQTT